MDSQVDAQGFRANVGIILRAGSEQQDEHGFQGQHRVLWARRVGGFDAWQFPQGGIHEGESIEAALYRELHEEIGLEPEAVTVLGSTQDWLYYRLPVRMRRNNSTPGFVGQKQRWFLLQLNQSESDISLILSPKPEFDQWRWVSYYYPIRQVVDFKAEVYRKALTELAPSLPVSDASASTDLHKGKDQ